MLMFPSKCPGSSGEIVKDRFLIPLPSRLSKASSSMKSKGETISKSVKLSSPKLKSWICSSSGSPIVIFSDRDSGLVFKS